MAETKVWRAVEQMDGSSVERSAVLTVVVMERSKD